MDTFRFTVDIETDFGGRTQGTEGIKNGLPKIIEHFEYFGIRALFFISTEIILNHQRMLQTLKDRGHEVGSHGHFHTIFKERFRKQADKDLSLLFFPENVRYRAPKFNYETEDRYSQKRGHVSLLRHMWLKEKVTKDTIIYLHPFDIVNTKEKSPNLFSRLWYSNPKKADETFNRLLTRFPHSYID